MIVRQDQLVGNVTKSCGCSRKELKGPALQTDRRIVLKKAVYYDLTRRHVRKLGFKKEDILSLEEFCELVDQPCAYCGKIGDKNKLDKYTTVSININGIDRIENNIGYSLLNSVSCCNWCNIAKKGMDVSSFATWAYRANKLIFSDIKMINSDKNIKPLVTIVRPNSKGGIRKINRVRMLFKMEYKKLLYDAKKRNRTFSITFDEYIYLIQQECNYCGLKYSRIIKDSSTGTTIKINSLDRIDSSGQYQVENIQTTCVFCNNAKNTKSDVEFKNLVKRLYPFSSLFIKK